MMRGRMAPASRVRGKGGGGGRAEGGKGEAAGCAAVDACVDAAGGGGADGDVSVGVVVVVLLVGCGWEENGEAAGGSRVVWQDELHTAPVQSSSSLYLPLSSSVPSTSLVPEMEEVKQQDERVEKRRERRIGGPAAG